MDATLDHVVFWVDDQRKALDFYEQVVGFPGVRAAEFRADQAPFPSVRLGPLSLIDLMPKAAAALFDGMFGGEGACGNRVSHLCFAVSAADYTALRARLAAAGVVMSDVIKGSFGAKGPAPEAFYFCDLDGNVLEARRYS